MLPEGTIRGTSIWKRFRADRRRKLLRDELEHLAHRLRGDANHGWRWALSDVSVRAEPGESIALVGANGSGKSTLLKILTRVMYPYAGRVEVGGRVGALIEVRAGIHPDLTGRENVYLYGSLLGLSRRAVAARFDEIVDFAELDDAIDRQVKFYSSGMQMRLGFGVAAFLEPDVLLVDEVLAVGDSSFQQRCLDRMRKVLADGTTLVFVSHDLAAVESTCHRAVWLDRGRARAEGPVGEVIGSYRRWIEESAEGGTVTDGIVRVRKAVAGGVDDDRVLTGGRCQIRLVIESPEAMPAFVCLGVSEGPATPMILLRRDLALGAGETDVRCEIERLPLPGGRYYLWAGVFSREKDLLTWHPTARFDVVGPNLDVPPRGIVRLAPVHVDARWDVERG